MSALLVGYARCSTEEQELTAQRDGLAKLGVEPEPVYVDHGLTGANRERPGLREALAACRAGDTLVVTKPDRLARSLPGARAIADELNARQVGVRPDRRRRPATVGRAGHGRRVRGRPDPPTHQEGMRVAKAKGHLRGKQPKPTRRQEAHLVSLVHGGEYSTAEAAELGVPPACGGVNVGRSTVHRAIERQHREARADLASAHD